MNKNWKKMPLRKQITEIRERAEQEPEAIISEGEIESFNATLQLFEELVPEDPFLMRITPLRSGAVTLDLYLRISLIAEFLTGIIEGCEEEIERYKKEIDKYTKLLKAFKTMLYGEKNQG